jgi:phospholipid/cholesterol/gamma-HCH transport system substrate-binding protein
MKGRTEVAVGSVIVLAVAVIVLGTIWLKGKDFGREEMVLQAGVSEIGQLVTGNAVKIRGVTVGRVTRIALDPRGDGVLVVMRILRDVPLPADPVVVVSPRSMFGDWQVEIHPRDRFPTFEFHDGPDPNVLPGYSLADISQMTAVADRIADNLAVITERVEVAFTEQAALNMQRAIENIQEVSEQLSAMLQSQQRTMDELGSNFAVTSRNVAEAAASAQQAFVRLDGALAEGELDAIVADIRAVANSADDAMRSFEDITRRVTEGHGTLGQLLQDSALYAELIQTNAALQDLLGDVKENPGRYVQFRFFGR